MGAAEDRAEQAARWRLFHDLEVDALPVYGRICAGVAGDDELLDLMSHAPRGQRRPNLLLALVHDLLLAGVDHPLSAWYPTVSGHPPPDADPFPAFADLVLTHRERITEGLATRSTQTNEVNRSCLWRVALAELGSLGIERVALVEVGASAGLNLFPDLHHYRYGEVDIGDPDAGADLVCDPIGGRATEAVLRGTLPTIAHRAGIDLHPIDPTDPDATRWLRACLWPEQPQRAARLEAAIAIAAVDAGQRTTPLVTRADAVDGLPAALEACPDDATVVVINSWVMTYLPRRRRTELAEVVDDASAERDVIWLCAEAPTVVEWMGSDPWGATHDGSMPSLVGVRHRRSGSIHTGMVARCHPHLAWLDWRGFGRPTTGRTLD